MNVQNGLQARLVYSIALPLVFISQTAIIKALITTFNLNTPRWFKSLWWIGIVFMIISFIFNANLYPIFHRVPDGYFFASPKSDLAFSILKIAVYGSSFIGFICILWLGLKKKENKVRWVYGLIIFVYCICMINDSVILQHHRTLYPTTWVGAVLLFTMLWRETYWHMQDIYTQVNLDKLTGAYSRAFGEMYLSECLKTQNVGLFYADIDNFKGINDSFGHRTGDLALQRMISLVKPLMCLPNLAVRLGGDEFLFLFPNIRPEDEVQLRTQLESLFVGMYISDGNDDKEKTPLSVSLGFAYARQNDSWIDIIHNADLSMYRTKEINKTNRYI